MSLTPAAPSPMVATAVLLAVASAQGAVTITPSSLNDGSVFVVQNDDLLQTSVASRTANPAFNYTNPNGIDAFTDGTFGEPNTAGASTAAVFADTFVQYNFDLVASPGGYRIAQIATYSGWDTGRDGQHHTVSYSTVAEPNVFIPIATVFYNPTLNFWNAHNRVVLTDTTGALADGVAAIRLDSLSPQEAGWALYRELDVSGAIVPEPAFASLAACAALILPRRRRQMPGCN